MGFGEDFSGKWLELLQETVPRLSTVAMIVNPNNVVARELAKDAVAIAPKRHLKVQIIEVREAEDFDGAFEQARRQAQGVLVHGDGLLTDPHRVQITALAAKHRLPAIYNLLSFMDSGGLMAYAPDFRVMFRQRSGPSRQDTQRVPSLPTCPSSSRINTCSSSISRPPRPSG